MAVTSGYVFNSLNSYATVVGERADANGGTVDINTNGNVYNLCPGGMEKLRFQWQFQFPSSNANPGGAFGVNLSSGQLSVSAPCRTQIASQSVMEVGCSSGSLSPFSTEFTRLIDGSRFDSCKNHRKLWNLLNG